MSTGAQVVVFYLGGLEAIGLVWAVATPSGRRASRDFFTALVGFRYWPPRAFLGNFRPKR